MARHRRSFLSFVVVTALGGFGAACGVKGPLYFPDKTETKKKKDKDKQKDQEKTSRRKSAPVNATLG